MIFKPLKNICIVNPSGFSSEGPFFVDATQQRDKSVISLQQL
jgi:hypothetical protein